MITLIRTISNELGTFGKMTLPGASGDESTTLYTCERPWLNNAPYTDDEPDEASCIPAGIYDLEPHSSTRSFIGKTVALVNRAIGVTHYLEEITKRFLILVHIGNRPADSRGCVLVGSSLVESAGQFYVVGSTDAHRKFKAYIADRRPEQMRITYAEGVKP